MKRLIVVLFAGLCLAIFVGCGGNEDNPLAPPITKNMTYINSRIIMGLWDFVVENNEINVTPLRTGDMHLNITRILENNLGLTVHSVIVDENELTFTVKISHPMSNTAYTVFDMRGILISSANYNFYVGETITWFDDDVRLKNFDGFTSVFNPLGWPEDFPAPPIFRYWKGSMATSLPSPSTDNPFVAFNKTVPRRMFVPGTFSEAKMVLNLPGGDNPIQFGYVVDACWEPRTGDTGNPEEDFPDNANCNEAYQVNVTTNLIGNNPGNTATIEVEVFDHQGLDSISYVAVIAPDLFDGGMLVEYSHQTGQDSFLYEGTIVNYFGTDIREYPLLVKIHDKITDPHMFDLPALQIATVQVVETGWAKTWGSSGFESAEFLAPHENGFYVAGYFQETVDMDPNDGIELRTSNGSNDIFLSSFDVDGNLLWVNTWGGIELDDPCAIVSSINSVFVVGSFRGTVDFDPGPGIDLHEGPAGSWNAFVSKFNSDGEFQWANTWSNPGATLTKATTVTVDQTDTTYVVSLGGNFSDVYFTSFSSSGEKIWEKRWGHAETYTAEVAIDESDWLYVVGDFKGSLDFNPEADEENIISSLGGQDIFLSKFDSEGNYYWTVHWGGSGEIMIPAGICYLPARIIVTGYFDGTAGFNPNDPQNTMTSYGQEDIFLTAVSIWEGDEIWTTRYGAVGSDISRGISCTPFTSFSNEQIIGIAGTIPPYPYAYGIDALLIQYNTDGELLSETTFGGSSTDYLDSVLYNSTDEVFLSGFFGSTVDFGIGLWDEDPRTSNGNSDAFVVKMHSYEF